MPRNPCLVSATIISCKVDRRTFYGAGPEGYTDYPSWSDIGEGQPGKYPLIDQSTIGTSLREARTRNSELA